MTAAPAEPVSADDPERGPRPGGPTLLLVLYHFPPLGGVSGARNARLTHHLAQHGWRSIVLTTRNPAEGPSDPTSVELVEPGTPVIRTSAIEAGGLRSMLVDAGLLAGRRARRRADVRSASPTTAADGAAGAVRSGGAPLGLSGLRRLIFFPDDQAGWLPFALAAVLRRRSTGSFDAIYSTSSPVTSHLIAGLTKRLTGVPWVAEFRDPWLGNALAAPLPWFHRRLQVRLERWIARTADALVCVTPSLAAMYHRRYPGATVVTITNGYERSERSRPTPRSSGPYRLVWTGSLYRPDELRVFLEGVTMLVDRRPAVREELSITLYGTVSAGCREVADRFGGSGPLAGMLSFPGFVPRPVALQAVADADAGLLLLGDGPGMELFATGKLFDYLGQGRQVFAMVPPGDARDILAELDWGVVADPRPEAVAGALERLLASARRNHYADPEGRYDRSVLVARLVRLLDEIVRPRRQADGSGGSR